MSDRTEQHEEFSFAPVPGEGTGTERPAASPLLPAGRSTHPFVASANPRHKACEKCGRIKHSAVHRSHPELRHASLLAHAEMAAKLVREWREDEAAIEIRTWLHIYEEDL